MPEFLYLLCFVTNAASALALTRMYSRHRTHLLFYSSVCFCGLTANSGLLLINLFVISSPALTITRAAVAAISTLTLVVALIWDLV
jgi:hypothetical protein